MGTRGYERGRGVAEGPGEEEQHGGRALVLCGPHGGDGRFEIVLSRTLVWGVKGSGGLFWAGGIWEQI